MIVTLVVSCSTGPMATDALVYTAKVQGPATQIHALNSHEKHWKITDAHRWRDLYPDVSPEGQLVFVSNRHQNASIDLRKHRDTFRVFLSDGRDKPYPLTQGPGSAAKPQFDPKGQTVAYLQASAEKMQLRTVPLGGEETNTHLEADAIIDFDWSPGGQALATVTRDSAGVSHLKWISLGDAADRTGPLVTAPEDTEIASVSVSPSGRYLAYILSQPGSRQLWLYDRTKRQSQPLSAADKHVQSPIRWTRDGHTLLYASLVDFNFYYDEKKREKVYQGGMHIFLTDLEGRERQLTQGDHRHSVPVFSPNEQRIAFLYADRLDARHLSLKTMDLQGGDVKTLRHKIAPESSLIWTSIPPNTWR